tara:strand:+ start:881 stop:1000 length:120 start_codon:yes stop_codon:yes gene_type:complete
MGSSLAARYDGMTPAIIPTKILKDIDVTASQMGMTEGKN